MRFPFVTFLFLAGCIAVMAQEPLADRLPTNEPDSPLAILYKPKAKYPVPETGTICMQGSITLRVEFRFDGTIGRIRIIKGLPFGATENAVEAAKQMQFLPEIRSGYYVTTSRPVSFSFNAY